MTDVKTYTQNTKFRFKQDWTYREAKHPHTMRHFKAGSEELLLVKMANKLAADQARDGVIYAEEVQKTENKRDDRAGSKKI